MLVLLGWLRPAAADLPAISPADTSPARVLKVTGERLLDTYIPDNERVASTFNHGLETFTRTATPAAAWLTLVKTNDTVGLKVYSVPGPICGTRAATVRAAVQGLLAAGLPPGHIIIWDKHPAELRAAGYYDLGRDLGVAVMSATETGYDSNTFYLPDSPVIGQLVWGDLEFGQTNRDTGKRSFVSKLVSQRLTKIISLVPLINEDAAGVCGHFYSLALGSVDNTLRFENDPGRLAVALPEIVAQPAVGRPLHHRRHPRPISGRTRRLPAILHHPEPVLVQPRPRRPRRPGPARTEPRTRPSPSPRLAEQPRNLHQRQPPPARPKPARRDSRLEYPVTELPVQPEHPELAESGILFWCSVEPPGSPQVCQNSRNPDGWRGIK